MTAKSQFILRVPDDVAAFLRKCHPRIKSQFRSGLQSILDNPHIGKALKEALSGLRSHRVKRYRIIYCIDVERQHIEIVAIGPRSIIYEETFRMLQR